MSKEAKKVKTKAKINWGWDAPEEPTHMQAITDLRYSFFMR